MKQKKMKTPQIVPRQSHKVIISLKKITFEGKKYYFYRKHTRHLDSMNCERERETREGELAMELEMKKYIACVPATTMALISQCHTSCILILFFIL